ncbi:MAG: hypothetical protein HKN85_12185 [Gammaproteobacteria bacterium]|nr:hypothetical protein [Gammaproteobacteria bacterium]
MAVITDIGLWELIKHLKQWLTNLRRAGGARKRQSRDALRGVILAARNTGVYVRRLNETGSQDHAEEARLSSMWTALGFQLTDLGLVKLAKRCDISGRYWSDPAQFDDDFLDKADVGLEKMERLARRTVAEIER